MTASDQLEIPDAPAPEPIPDDLPVADLVQRMVDAGGRLLGLPGSRKLVGNLPAPLRAALLARGKEVAAEWDRQEAARRNRYLKAPDEDLPLHERSRLNDRHRALLTDYVANQLNLTLATGDHALRHWFATRVIVYVKTGIEVPSAEMRAALDLVCWQRRAEPPQVWPFLEGLEESRREMRVKP
jgi:hypothetical protein